MTLLSSLEFGALLAYTPRPETDEQRKSREMMRLLKGDHMVAGPPPVSMSTWLVDLLVRFLEGRPFNDYFQGEVTLVPVPSSSLRSPGALWVPLNLAQAMEQRGLGRVAELLTRVSPLPKSATAVPERRSRAADHLLTLHAESRLDVTNEILLVDDVVTRGATLLGAASRVQMAYPQARVRALVMMRAVSDTEDFTTITDSCVGSIMLRPDGTTLRRP